MNSSPKDDKALSGIEIDPELLKKYSGISLDIACGQHKQPGFFGIDIRDWPGVDLVWDVNIHPWPLPDECATRAFSSHLIEHIPPVAITEKGTIFPFIMFMDEVWRLLKPEGQFALSYPHGSSQGFLQDPTHCNACNEASMAYFDPLEPNTNGFLYKFYRPKPWKINHLTWSPAANVEVILEKRREDHSYYE